MKRTARIQSQQEFDELMTKIDEKLQKDNIPIQGRSLHGLGEASKYLHMSLKGGPLTTGPIPGVYEGDSLSAHIFAWFDAKYGDRLKVDYSIGAAVYLLRGDPWTVSFPSVYGTVRLICEPDLSQKFPSISVSKPGEQFQPPLLNIFTCIRDIPQTLISKLSFDESQRFMNFFVRGHNAFNILSDLGKTHSLANAAKYDLTMATRNCCNSPAQLEQSKWLSLQGVEKSLKLFIEKKGGSFPHTHKLVRLVEIANTLGLPPIDSNLIDSVQCDAGIRYESGTVSILEAANAQLGAFKITQTVVETI